MRVVAEEVVQLAFVLEREAREIVRVQQAHCARRPPRPLRVSSTQNGAVSRPLCASGLSRRRRRMSSQEEGTVARRSRALHKLTLLLEALIRQLHHHNNTRALPPPSGCFYRPFSKKFGAFLGFAWARGSDFCRSWRTWVGAFTLYLCRRGFSRPVGARGPTGIYDDEVGVRVRGSCWREHTEWRRWRAYDVSVLVVHV